MSHDIAIRTRGLTKDFGRLRAVDGLDLEVRRGEVFGFLGPNGAGKTTTIRMLLGLIRPTEGDAELLGVSVRRDRLQALRRVGAMVEVPAFYEHLSGRRNLQLFAALSGGATRQRIDEVLLTVGLMGRDRDKVGAYSHGMKQRLGLANALLPGPELLVLDEPATGLDPQGMREVRDLVRKLGEERGMTIFLSSHLLHEVEQICSHVGMIRDGKLIACGPVAELLGRDTQEATLLVDDSRLAAEVLAREKYVQVLRVEDGRLRFQCELGRFADVNQALVARGLRVSALVPEKTSLEELYLSVMGEGADT